MAESDALWQWLNAATREARDAIDRLYRQGRDQVAETCPDDVPTPPSGDAWPTGPERKS